MPKHFAKIFEVEGQQVLYRLDLNEDGDEVVKMTIFNSGCYEMTCGPFEDLKATDVLDGYTN